MKIDANSWIELAREQLAKTTDGDINPATLIVPEIHNYAFDKALQLVRGATNDLRPDPNMLDLDELLDDGRFEARWAFLYCFYWIVTSGRGFWAAQAEYISRADEIQPDVPEIERISSGFLHIEDDGFQKEFLGKFRPINTLNDLRLAICASYVIGAADAVPQLLREVQEKALLPPEYVCVISAQHQFITTFSGALTGSRLRLKQYVESLFAGTPNPHDVDSRPELWGGIAEVVWQAETPWAGSGIWPNLLSFSLNPGMVHDSRCPSRERLISTITALQSVVEEARCLFIPLEACCFFHLGDFRRAKDLVKQWQHEGDEFLQDFFLGPQSLAFEVACNEAMKNYVLAREELEAGLLRLWEIEECRRRTEPLWQNLARLKYREKDFAGAIEALQRATSISPSGIDWERALLVESAKQGPHRMSATFQEMNPVMAHGLQSTTASQWPRFRTLLDGPRQDWVFGLYAAHFLTQSNLDYSNTYEQYAVGAFSKTVEVELRDNVFRQFRKWAVKRPDVMALAQSEKNTDTSKELARFLNADSSLTLGQMSYALSMARTARSKLFIHLQTWVRSQNAGLLEQAVNIEALTKMRNNAVHQQATQRAEDAEKLATVILNNVRPCGD